MVQFPNQPASANRRIAFQVYSYVSGRRSLSRHVAPCTMTSTSAYIKFDANAASWSRVVWIVSRGCPSSSSPTSTHRPTKRVEPTAPARFCFPVSFPISFILSFLAGAVAHPRRSAATASGRWIWSWVSSYSRSGSWLSKQPVNVLAVEVSPFQSLSLVGQRTMTVPPLPVFLEEGKFFGVLGSGRKLKL